MTYYGHLSGYGPGIRRGVRVGQKQIIGYVGSTGLSTGPHLDYRLAKDGQFRNPLNEVFPAGLAKLSNLWKAPMPDYAFKGWEERGLSHLSFAYIISAFLGITITVLLVLFIGKKLTKKD
jgi:hypothetical protein